MQTHTLAILWLALMVLLLACSASAHNVSTDDVRLIVGKTGWHFGLYLWLGAKHMVTGYDHLLFLVGVVFYLTSFRSIVLYVSLFSLGHSLTLIFGVLANLNVSAQIVDAIIGFSVIYKGFDNLNGFQTAFGVEPPDERLAILVFGLFHGLGLATKLQDLGLNPDGLLANLLSFNLGVEAGQLLALIAILLMLKMLPARHKGAGSDASDSGGVVGRVVNAGLMLGGASLMFYQLFSL